MFRPLLQRTTGFLQAASRSPVLRAVPTPLLSRTLSLTTPARPTVLSSPSPLQTSLLQQQTRTFKTPKAMRKKVSPLSRSGGGGKTARRNSKRKAKRRSKRMGQIN
ncbi:hypothetical protein T439DRAFT_328050 [Meredithblackwellia eburnea MCA 4105]